MLGASFSLRLQTLALALLFIYVCFLDGFSDHFLPGLAEKLMKWLHEHSIRCDVLFVDVSKSDCTLLKRVFRFSSPTVIPSFPNFCRDDV